MCCPPSGWQGRPSAFGLTREEAQALARQQIAEKKKLEAMQANASDYVSKSSTISGSDHDSGSIEMPRLTSNDANPGRMSFGTHCRQKLRKCLP